MCVCHLKNTTHERKDEQNEVRLFELTIAHQEMKLICG